MSGVSTLPFTKGKLVRYSPIFSQKTDHYFIPPHSSKIIWLVSLSAMCFLLRPRILTVFWDLCHTWLYSYSYRSDVRREVESRCWRAPPSQLKSPTRVHGQDKYSRRKERKRLVVMLILVYKKPTYLNCASYQTCFCWLVSFAVRALIFSSLAWSVVAELWMSCKLDLVSANSLPSFVLVSVSSFPSFVLVSCNSLPSFDFASWSSLDKPGVVKLYFFCNTTPSFMFSKDYWRSSIWKSTLGACGAWIWRFSRNWICPKCQNSFWIH